MMPTQPSALPGDGETIAELRELYRAAEARAARLRLLSVSGRDLAEADLATLDAALTRCAQRLAFFVGCRQASITGFPSQGAIPIHAPGQDDAAIAGIRVEGLGSLAQIPDAEDREAVRMQLDLMGAAIARIRAESERADLFAALQAREKTLETLLERIFTAQEEERRRVSHELHDGVAQTATALVRLLENDRRIDRRVGGDSAAATGVDTAEVARSLVSELRRVIAGLRPTLLDDLGLVPALQSLADGLETEGYRVTLRLAAPRTRLSPLVETALFRVAQEAVSNIRKHAGGRCAITIEADFTAGDLLLRIADRGGGPSDAMNRTGAYPGNNVGIDVMRERMAAIGGTLDWRSDPAGGVIVEARLGPQD